jgi:hypothetical protein
MCPPLCLLYGKIWGSGQVNGAKDAASRGLIKGGSDLSELRVSAVNGICNLNGESLREQREKFEMNKSLRTPRLCGE